MPGETAEKGRKSLLAWIGTTLTTAGQDLLGAFAYLTKPEQRKIWLRDLRDLSRRFGKRFGAESVGREAGSLTYLTILGFVPFIVLIVMLAPELPFLNLKEKIFVTISNNLMPTSALAVNDLIEDMLARRAGFNIFSFVILILSSYSLFSVIRKTFDRILNIPLENKLDMLTQLIRFLGTIILGVLIMVVLFSSTSLPLVTRLLRLPYLKWMGWVMPFLMQFFGLFFLYMLLPSNKIRRSALIRGAFWTTVVWVLVKSGFDFYIVKLTNFQAMYGVLAALPILLLWIYVNWIIILGGIVLVSTIENRNDAPIVEKGGEQMVKLTMEFYKGSKLKERLERVLREEQIADLGSPGTNKEEQ